MEKPAKIHRLGDLQLKIMRVLWARREAGVGDVHDALASEGLAYTTVATMLRKMEDRGLVRHRAEGRMFIYEPLIVEEAVTQGMTEDLVNRLFSGSLADFVTHFLSTREISRDELVKIEKLIAERKKRK